jgi:DNA polymerase (family 10)
MGRCALLSELHKHTPPALPKWLAIPGLDPKRVQALHRDRHIRAVEQLARAVRAGRIHELPGFGEKSEQHLLQAIASRPSLTSTTYG